jgi:hypothetical protein
LRQTVLVSELFPKSPDQKPQAYQTARLGPQRPINGPSPNRK